MNLSRNIGDISSAGFENAPIFVTGAAGKTGQAVLKALVARRATVRALVRRPEQVRFVRELGAIDVVVGDIQEQATITEAMQGIRAVYYICPNMHPFEITIGEMMIEAALQAEVEHFVYHSVLHPQAESMPHHWTKLRVEEHLFESGLPFSILQPTAYMQNILAHRQRILEDGVYPLPYSVSAQLSLVDLIDVGEAAAIVLTELGHQFATYELSGTWPISQDEVVAEISRQIGRDVRPQVVDLVDWQGQARRAGLGAYQVDTLSRMFLYYDANGLVGNPNVLGWLLGRAPTRLPDFIRRSFLA